MRQFFVSSIIALSINVYELSLDAIPVSEFFINILSNLILDFSPTEIALSLQLLNSAFKIKYLPKEKSMQSLDALSIIAFLIITFEKSKSIASYSEFLKLIFLIVPLVSIRLNASSHFEFLLNKLNFL